MILAKTQSKINKSTYEGGAVTLCSIQYYTPSYTLIGMDREYVPRHSEPTPLKKTYGRRKGPVQDPIETL